MGTLIVPITKKFRQGEVIFLEEQRAELKDFMQVKEGVVQLCISEPYQGRSLAIDWILPGQFLGEDALKPGVSRHRWTAVASSRRPVSMVPTSCSYEELIDSGSYKELAHRRDQLLQGKIRSLLSPLPYRLADFMLNMPFQPMTHEQIAIALGSSRERITCLMSQLYTANLWVLKDDMPANWIGPPRSYYGVPAGEENRLHAISSWFRGYVP